MKLKHLQFLALLFWGVQTDLLLFALPMAIILEGRFYTDRRWALERQDFYRMADLTALALVGIVVFLFLNRVEYHFITKLIAWLPILLFPLVTVLAYSTTERMPLDVLFYSLRRQTEPVRQSWDMSWVFFGVCLVAAGSTTDGHTLYLPITATLMFAALYQLRSPRYPPSLWLLMVLTVFLGGTLFNQALRAGHLELQEHSRKWLASYIRNRTNPLKTQSSIGVIGRLKSSDDIVFRVKPESGVAAPALLQEATYDSPSGTDWMVLNPQFQTVPQAADFTWRFKDSPAPLRAKVYLEFQRDRALVPVPADLVEIFDLPALNLRQSHFGSIQALGLVPSPGFEIAWQGPTAGVPGDLNSEPGRSDLFVPQEYRETLSSLLPVNAMDGVAAGGTSAGHTSAGHTSAGHTSAGRTDPRQRVRAMLANHRYSLYQDLPSSADPLIAFLTETRAGHCEYFATATVLALRHLGVPARYAVGYSVQEWSETLDMYIVRDRHAHAWALAWIDGRWQVVDTTPSVWSEVEAMQGSFARPAVDAMANVLFLLQLWWSEVQIDDYEKELYVIGALLLLVLIWRLAKSEQVRLGRGADARALTPWPRPGLDSPFFRIESHLIERGYHRHPGEPFEAWIDRIGRRELAVMIASHNRLRFDPDCPEETWQMLSLQVRAWLEAQASEVPQSQHVNSPAG